MNCLFHEPDTTVRKVKVVCSNNERRCYEQKSVFFVHPLFNGETKWPEKTHIVCRYDEEPFDTIPIPLPIDYDSQSNTYTCYGLFCSASCVKAFMETVPVYNNALSIIWLKKIMCEVFGDFEDIIEAPPKDLLIKHGGELNIQQFRAFGKQKTRILPHAMPFFTCSLAFELVKEYGGKLREKTVEQETKDVRKLKRSIVRKKIDADGSQTKEELEKIGDVGGSLKHMNIGENLELSPSTSQFLQPPAVPPPPPPPSSLPPTSQPFDLLQNTSQNPSQNLFSNNSNPFNPPNDNISVTNVLNPPDSSHYSPINSLSLLPDSITVVPANVGNRWEIRGLRRPAQPVETPVINQTSGKSLFQEFLEQKSKDSSSNVPHKTIDQDTKPHKKRGRPKTVKTKAESPKNNNKGGSLVSFLKN
jgi:hypothetical protein